MNQPTDQKNINDNISPVGYANGQQNYDAQEQLNINWRKYIFLILNNWHWFLITLFFALGIAYLKNRYTLPTYQVSATLLIEDEQNSGDLMSEFRSIRYFRNRTQLANEIAKLNAFALHRRTIDSLDWSVLWTGHGRVAAIIPMYKAQSNPFNLIIDTTSSDWYLNKEIKLDVLSDNKLILTLPDQTDTIIEITKWINIRNWRFKIDVVNKPTLASYSFKAHDPNTLARQFRSKVNFESDEDMGTVITATSSGRIPAMEIDYLNKLLENYIAFGLERKRLIADNSLTFIQEQIDVIRDSLEQAERQLLSFRLSNNVIDLSREGEMAYEKLNKFFDRKNQLRFNRNYYEYLKEYITSQSDPQAIITPTLVGADDPLLLEQVASLQMLYAEKEALGFAAEAENPGIRMKNEQIKSARDKLIQILDGLLRNNELAIKQIDAEEKNIEDQLLKLPVSEQELLNIRRKHEVTNQFYTFLLQKQAEAGIQRASTISNIRILDRADNFNITPIGARKTVIYLIALIIGIILPGSLLLLIDLFDTRVKELNDIKANSTLPILGVVTHNQLDNQIPVYTNPGSAFAESFRHLRTNLNYLIPEEDQKVIMVTSTISGEGKSFIALNIAAILAMNNKKVLLLGMDLRRPTLHKVFNIENKQGISQILINKNTVLENIRETHIENLNFMSSGPIPPNPAEILASGTMSSLFKELKKQTDFIVIDTPPLALVTDAQLISRYADTNIFVVRQQFSRKEMFTVINDLASKFKSSSSLIINDIRQSRVLGYYYGYGYGYGYGYEYGYRQQYGRDYFEDE